MRFDNIYFINGTAYAGKSTMVHLMKRMVHSITRIQREARIVLKCFLTGIAGYGILLA